MSWFHKNKAAQSPQSTAQERQPSQIPQKDLSQRTVAAMAAVYRRLFIERGPYWGAGPPLDIDKLGQALYGMGFQREFVQACEYNFHWHFESLFPCLKDGAFFRQAGLHNYSPVDSGNSALIGFATALCGMLETNPSLKLPDSEEFVASLLDDGFQFVGTRLVETNQDIISEAQERSAVETLINDSTHDCREVLLKHFFDGHHLFELGQYHASISEWRAFLEETLRGIWRTTRAKRPEFSSFAAAPPMKDVLSFLSRSGFLVSDEHLAFSSTWGFLSSGGHPGISDKDEAHLAMILALTFAHAALLKFQQWSASACKHF